MPLLYDATKYQFIKVWMFRPHLELLSVWSFAEENQSLQSAFADGGHLLRSAKGVKFRDSLFILTGNVEPAI